MCEKDWMFKIVVMEKHKVEIMMPEQDAIEKDEDEKGLGSSGGMCRIVKNISSSMHAWRGSTPQSSYNGRMWSWNLNA